MSGPLPHTVEFIIPLGESPEGSGRSIRATSMFAAAVCFCPCFYVPSMHIQTDATPESILTMSLSPMVTLHGGAASSSVEVADHGNAPLRANSRLRDFGFGPREAVREEAEVEEASRASDQKEEKAALICAGSHPKRTLNQATLEVAN